MAKKLGVSQQSYAKMESNITASSVDRLYTILRLLNVQIIFSVGDAAVERGSTKRRTISHSHPAPGGLAEIANKSYSYKTKVQRPKTSKKNDGSVAMVRTTATKVTPRKLVKRSDTTKW
jgi:HTH-type transcriptional regulator/antitoxin HipB